MDDQFNNYAHPGIALQVIILLAQVIYTWQWALGLYWMS